MVKNYFVVAIRYLMRHKLYTFINLFGLGLGLACCLMMALFVKHEWAFDGFHQNEDELFRVVKQRLLPNGEAGAFGSIEGANLKDPVIIGIVRDFHTDALYEPIQPVVLQMSQFNNWPAFFVHMRSDQLSDTLDMLKETWKAIVPSGRFQFSFLDRNLHRQYEQEDRWREIVSHSALFSIIISCLGLFGLASLGGCATHERDRCPQSVGGFREVFGLAAVERLCQTAFARQCHRLACGLLDYERVVDHHLCLPHELGHRRFYPRWCVDVWHCTTDHFGTHPQSDPSKSSPGTPI